ncbi:uncharacterized [Tachysurus ichikawai]
MTDWLTLCRLRAGRPSAQPLLRLSTNYTKLDGWLLKSRTEAARVKSSMERAASTQIYGQSVYLALCGVDMLRSRLFHGPPYLNHVLLPPLLPPSDRMPPQESLQDDK